MDRPQPLEAEDFALALECSGVGVWAWNIRTGEVRWSEQVFRLFNISRAQFGGTLEAYLAFLPADDQKQVRETIQATLESGTDAYAIEHRYLPMNGELRWLDARGRVERDAQGNPIAMLGSVADCTARKGAELALRESQERARLFTAHATDYVYEARFDRPTPSLIPTIVAGSFERTTAYTPEQVAEIGGWLKLILPEDQHVGEQVAAHVQQGLPVTVEYRILDGTGRVRWLRDRVVPVLNDQRVLVSMVGGVTDISEQKQLQARLVESEKMEALARLASGVAHDFNNLLTILMGECAFLSDPEASLEGRRASLKDINATLEKAADLTSSLLAFGKNQHRPTHVVDVAEAVRAGERILSRSLSEAFSLRVELPACAVTVRGRETDIQRILLNLVLNARDAMPSGGEIVVSLGVTELGEAVPERPPELPPGVYAELIVEDSGSGIPEEFKTRIFEPYFTTKGAFGTGLGLSSSFGVAKTLGGLLELVTSSEAGTAFRLLVPVEVADSGEPSGGR